MAVEKAVQTKIGIRKRFIPGARNRTSEKWVGGLQLKATWLFPGHT